MKRILTIITIYVHNFRRHSSVVVYKLRPQQRDLFHMVQVLFVLVVSNYRQSTFSLPMQIPFQVERESLCNLPEIKYKYNITNKINNIMSLDYYPLTFGGSESPLGTLNHFNYFFGICGVCSS